jgi:hypothetical protein
MPSAGELGIFDALADSPASIEALAAHGLRRTAGARLRRRALRRRTRARIVRLFQGAVARIGADGMRVTLATDGAGLTADARAAPARSPQPDASRSALPGRARGGRAAEISAAPPHRSCRSKKPWTSRP